jgi:aspartate beta-hydroxylase
MEYNSAKGLVQVLARHDTGITSPTFGPSGDLFTISTAGDIFRYVGNVESDDNMGVETWSNPSGQPLGMVFDNKGTAFVCDAAHQAILQVSREETEDGLPRQSVQPYMQEFEQSQLIGPNSLCFASKGGMLYFTDSGPFGETSLQNPRGSVYCVNYKTNVLTPLVLNTLAHPSGIAASPDEKVIYVAETMMNRILRLSQYPAGIYHSTVFHQLQGRIGPTALAMNKGGNLFVAHYDLRDVIETGKILEISPDGEVLNVYIIPGPEITGLCLVPPNENVLLVTERSTNSIYRVHLR